MSVYDHQDYRSALRAQVVAGKKSRRLSFQGLAEAVRVQKPFLSKVVNAKSHFRPDHLFLAADYLALNEPERRYLFLLFEHETSSLAQRKSAIRNEILAVKDRRLRTDHHLAGEKTRPRNLGEYFRDPVYQLVHMALGIERYRLDPAQISADFDLLPARLEGALKVLVTLCLISRKDGRIEVLQPNVHLPADTPAYQANKILTRAWALGRLQRHHSPHDTNLAVTFTADAAAHARIREKFLRFLKEVEQEVAGAPKEDVYQLNFDLFRWRP